MKMMTGNSSFDRRRINVDSIMFPSLTMCGEPIDIASTVQVRTKFELMEHLASDTLNYYAFI
jgi:hypothetical protein